MLALLPGLLLALVAAAGWVPTARDGPSYFVPLRLRTAQVLRGEKSPWLNTSVGCGEPFFANPQSALLYPPAWWSLLLPAERAVGVEVGLHLAFLGLGVFFLTRRLGGSQVGALAAAWGVQSCGPVLSAAGMLNNLESTAWLPWMWWAALTERPRLLALTATGSFLAAEPALAFLGLATAFFLAPSRRNAAAVGLGLLLPAAQLVPMIFWILGGNRGPGQSLEAMTLGGVSAPELLALFFPGVSLREAGQPVVFLPLVTVPAWVGLALLSGAPPGRSRRLLGLAGGFLFLALLPTLPWGDALWFALTFGLVRLPGRFLLPAAVAAVAYAGSRSCPQKRWWLAVAAIAGAVGALVSRQPLAVVAQFLAAALVPWAPAAACLGSLALLPSTLPVLELRRWQPAAVPCLESQRGARLFPLPVDNRQLRWAMDHGPEGARQLAWGYSVLLDGRSSVRSHAPLVNRHLAAHLREADKGPEAAWWVASLAAGRLLALQPVAAYPPLCRQGDMWVLANPRAFPLWALVRRLPAPGEWPEPVGTVEVLEEREDFWRFRVRGKEAGLLLWLFAPDAGFCFVLDGRRVFPERGVGLLQGLAVPPGEHQVVVSYRPPGLWVGLGLSLLALGGVTWRRW